MKNVIVYGSGCKRCEITAELIESQAAKLGVPVAVTKETDMAKIAMAGVMSTPGHRHRRQTRPCRWPAGYRRAGSVALGLTGALPQ